MKKGEFIDAIKELHKKATPLLVDEEVLSESVQVGNDTWKVYLGDTLIYKLNDKNVNDWDLRRAFTSREKAWQTLLGGLETKITLAEGIHANLLKVVAQSYVKEEVLNRLVGEDANFDNEQIISRAVDRRIKKLSDSLPDWKVWDNREFDLPSPSENYGLQVKFNRYDKTVLYGAGGLKCYWSFLRHYDEIEATIKKFISLITPVIKFCKKEE